MKANAMSISHQGFQGIMHGAALHDLIQFECLAMNTRAVRIERDSWIGRIFFAGGQIVHAEVGTITGERALFELLAWEGGQFFFEDGVRSMENTIDRDWHGLLIEAAHRRDEVGELSQPKSTTQNTVPMTAIPMPKLSIAEMFRDPEVLQAVQFSEEGDLLEARADDPEMMQSSFAYIEQLSRLVGTALGAEGLHEILAVGVEKKAICSVGASTTTALIVTPKANITGLLAKLA